MINTHDKYIVRGKPASWLTYLEHNPNYIDEKEVGRCNDCCSTSGWKCKAAILGIGFTIIGIASAVTYFVNEKKFNNHQGNSTMTTQFDNFTTSNQVNPLNFTILNVIRAVYKNVTQGQNQ